MLPSLLDAWQPLENLRLPHGQQLGLVLCDPSAHSSEHIGRQRAIENLLVCDAYGGAFPLLTRINVWGFVLDLLYLHANNDSIYQSDNRHLPSVSGIPDFLLISYKSIISYNDINGNGKPSGEFMASPQGQAEIVR